MKSRKKTKDLLDEKIKVDQLKLAELKYYDAEENGVEVSQPLSYIVLLQNGDDYVNLLAPEENYPVFRRNSHYTNYCSSGETYGSKVVLIGNEERLETGPCWVLCDDDFSEKLVKKLGEVITIRDVQQYVLDSNYYFKDRLDIASVRSRGLSERRKMNQIVRKDIPKKDALYTFFEVRQAGQTYIKK